MYFFVDEVSVRQAPIGLESMDHFFWNHYGLAQLTQLQRTHVTFANLRLFFRARQPTTYDRTFKNGCTIMLI